jgi:hypothetical protein
MMGKEFFTELLFRMLFRYTPVSSSMHTGTGLQALKDIDIPTHFPV